jgi:hypothetical protein
VAEHHSHVSVLDMFETARLHVESRNGHEVLAADDQGTRRFGFVCTTCRATFMISVENYREWITQCPPEPRRLISLFMYNRSQLAGVINARGDLLRHVEPLLLDVTDEPRRTAYQMLVEDD